MTGITMVEAASILWFQSLFRRIEVPQNGRGIPEKIM